MLTITHASPVHYPSSNQELLLNLGTTKVKMASSQPEQEGKLPEFVERRRAALERYLNRTAIHPIFQVDPDFRDFLECGK